MASGKDPQKSSACTCRHKCDPQVEDLILMFPGSTENICTDSKNETHKSVLEFYRWYLKNETRLKAFTVKQKSSIDFIPLFNINWEEMQQYVNSIRKNYPGIDTVHLTTQDTNSTKVGGAAGRTEGTSALISPDAYGYPVEK
jgi:hypothetical protein